MMFRDVRAMMFCVLFILELQESFIQALWSKRNSTKRLPTPRKDDPKRMWLGGFMIPHDDKRYRCKSFVCELFLFVYMVLVI